MSASLKYDIAGSQNGQWLGRLMYQLDVHRNRYFVGVAENPLFCICSTSLANGPLKTSVSVLQYEEMGLSAAFAVQMPRWVHMYQ